jgi:hypothetical protein
MAMSNTDLPAFPRPDLPESSPENFPTLRVRVFRRLGMPDDGRLFINDAIQEHVLRGYNGVLLHDSETSAEFAFASLADAVAWAEGVTTHGRDREMIKFTSPPSTPYQAATITIEF